jgi:hypothetical protein
MKLGYGLYFTDRRLIGVSYREIVSRAYRPFFVSSLVFIMFLGFSLVLAGLGGIPSDQLNLIGTLVGPILFGLSVTSLVFFYIISPRLSTVRIQREAANSLMDLANKHEDLVLDRPDVLQVTIQVAGIDILTRLGDWYHFVNVLGQNDASRLKVLLHKFCAQDPPIGLYNKRKKQWEVLPEREIPT